MENMDFNSRATEPQISFYLSSLEEQVRCELKDSEATLTQGKSEGRLHLVIREDLLADLLDQLQQQREGSSWSHEEELMQKEIGELKVQLAERVPSPLRETEHLKAQLGKICTRLRKSEKDLDPQTFIAEGLKAELEQIKGEKEALKREVETLKVGKTNVQLELESFLGRERAQVQELKEKLSKTEEAIREQEKEAKEKMQRSQASHRAQLDEALAQRVPSPPGETEHLKSQLGKICTRLRKAEKDLELQIFITEDLKVELKQVKGEKQTLYNIVATQKLQL
ncbi:ribonuclease Y-like [Etheostoma cragini]|uniref:ribonuclease Y-like n=1 Tax=Etheostoma cragini TaxID=417921 RepID=UPI00155E92FA|nr:ribonuclease Y-like [Etheostoma cragini]